MHARKDADLGPLPEGTPAQIPTLLLTLPEVAAHLRVSKSYVEVMIRNDVLPFVKVGRERMVSYDDLRAWVKRRRRFHSYYITPETFRLQRKQEGDQRLDAEFAWD